MAGRTLLQIPGPTNVPQRVLEAIAHPTMDHRGPAFADLVVHVHQQLQRVFQTRGPVVMFPSSGTGAWEAALVNTLSPGDRVLFYETGHFASIWAKMADRLGLNAVVVGGDWRRGVVSERIARALAEDKEKQIRAVCIVHNETSTGALSDVQRVRKVLDDANHPALFMVDTISSLGSVDYFHDNWGVDVTIGASQKGLMLPPGLSFNVPSMKALSASKDGRYPRCYWHWADMLANADRGAYPYTPASNLVVGLREALTMLLDEEGMPAVIERHRRLASATRACVRAWGLDIQCTIPDDQSSVLTAVRLPDDYNADELRDVILKRFDVALGSGLGQISGKVFRIGHLGDLNDTMLVGTLAAIEMGLGVCNIPIAKSGIVPAMEHLAKVEV